MMTQQLYCITGHRWLQVVTCLIFQQPCFQFPLESAKSGALSDCDWEVIPALPTFLDKTFRPKVVLLRVISQSPLVPDLVSCPPVSLFLWMNSLTGAGAGSCKHLYMKQAFLNTFKFSKSRNLCFSKTLQRWQSLVSGQISLLLCYTSVLWVLKLRCL